MPDTPNEAQTGSAELTVAREVHKLARALRVAAMDHADDTGDDTVPDDLQEVLWVLVNTLGVQASLAALMAHFPPVDEDHSEHISKALCRFANQPASQRQPGE